MSHLGSTSWTARESTWFGTAPLLVLILFAVADLALGFSTGLAGWPFLISLFVVGLPHGAGDLIVNARLAGRTSVAGTLTAFAGYVAVMGLVIAAFVLWPLGTLLAFGIVTALHFGSADVEDLIGRGDRELADRGTRPLAVFARGALIVALPFATHPEASLGVVAGVAGLAGGVTTVDSATVQQVALMIVGLAAMSWGGVLLLRASEGRLHDARRDAAETSGLVLAFSTLHPLFAMGLYFLVWHSWRHTRHLHHYLDDEPGFDLVALGRLHARSLPLLIPTLVVIAAVTWWAGLGWSATSLALVAIAAFVVVTPSHHLVVERLHRRLRPVAATRVPLSEQVPS